MAALWAAGVPQAHANGQPKYYFSLEPVQLANPAWSTIGGTVASALSRDLKTSRTEIVVELPKDAPDPAKQPARFTKYLKKRGLAGYRLGVEITAYEQTIEKAEKGKLVSTTVSVRVFGDTLPRRKIGFFGTGRASIKMEVGNKPRKRDLSYADKEVAELAIRDGVDAALTKLRALQHKSRRKR
jgi:hypothetical protein